MIEIKDVSKRFEDVQALSNVNLGIQGNEIFGLVGSNGAGKSTLMRILSGVLKGDTGTVLIDGKEVYESPRTKERVFYISDNQYFRSNQNPQDIFNFYNSVYPKFSQEKFDSLIRSFGLEKTRKVNAYSKGMKKQLSMILALSSGAEYLLCDETFDGLDPVAKQGVKSLLIEGIRTESITPIIASHNLRELEDICDHVGLLHKGGVLLSKEVSNLKMGVQKLQVVSKTPLKREDFAPLKVLSFEHRGSVYTLILDGTKEHIAEKIKSLQPVFYETLPLNLEEVFITETEVAGYDIKSILE